ncbi:MAG TPA: hypothetical protein VNJ53_04430 [Gaiellaceae bacterium]|nr:hypothetical protein [Gaiellaceae bacterium]
MTLLRPLAAGLAAALVAGAGATAARISGTERADLLVGTPRADTLAGLGGADRLLALGGDDELDGGPGRDLLTGGPGHDRLAAEYDGARDRVSCGPGRDVVTADALDVVAADCERVGRRLSRDPYTTPDAQHETQVEPDSLTVGRTTVAAFQVGRRHDGGASNIGFAVSDDDGRTWTSGLLPALTRASVPAGPHERASDPVVAFDAATGTWLIATLALEGTTTRLVISRSTDGRRWSAPVVAAEGRVPRGIAFDKEWLACDNGGASPFRGRCYLVYTDALENDALGVKVSADGGLTWSPPVHAHVTGAVGAFPVVRPTGEVVVPFLWGGRRIGVAVSRDGGLTFDPPAAIADVRVRATPGLRFFHLPAADVDAAGRVWVTWHACRSLPDCPENTIVVARSPDGVTWEQPVGVVSARNALVPALAADGPGGRVALAYHVLRADGTLDVEHVLLGPDRRPLASPVRLSARSMRREWLPTTTSGRMLADYISVHWAGGVPLVVWALASPPAGGELRQAIYATRVR